MARTQDAPKETRLPKHQVHGDELRDADEVVHGHDRVVVVRVRVRLVHLVAAERHARLWSGLGSGSGSGRVESGREVA